MRNLVISVKLLVHAFTLKGWVLASRYKFSVRVKLVIHSTFFLEELVLFGTLTIILQYTRKTMSECVLFQM